MNSSTHNRMNLIIQANPREYFFWALSLVWSKFMVVDLPAGLIGRLFGRELVQVVVSVFIALLLIGSYRYFIKVITQWDVLFLAIVVVTYFLNIWFYNNSYNGQYLKENIYTILVLNFGMYFIGLRTNESEIVDRLHLFSLGFVILEFFYLFFHIASFFTGKGNEFMGYAYLLIPHLCLITGLFIKNKRFYDIPFIILGFLILISCGSRGPILLYLAYLPISIILLSNYNKRWISILVVSALTISVFLAYEPILRFFQNVMNILGTSTRFIDYLLSNNIIDARGRDIITSKMFELIKAHPIVGNGLAGDRGYTWTAYSSVFDMNYAHNIIIELWVSFGVIIGSFLFIVLCRTIIRGYIKCHDYKLKILLLSLIFGNGFLFLFFSGSYLLAPNFFFLLGICISINRKKSIKRTDMHS